jgi:hypothetical protein
MTLQSCSRQPRRKPILQTQRSSLTKNIPPPPASGVPIMSHPQPRVAYLTHSLSPDTNQETSTGRLGFSVRRFSMLFGSPERHVPRCSGSLCCGKDVRIPPRPSYPCHRGEAWWLHDAQQGPTRPSPGFYARPSSPAP